MTEQEYQKLLQDRVELLEQIKRVQAEVAKGGMIPPATRAYNRLLRERTELLQKQQQIERSIRGAPSGVVAANQFRSEVAANLEGLRQQRLQQQQAAAMAQAVRRADLQSRYGAGLGGSLAALEAMRNSGAGRMLGGAAIGAGAMVGGMARQGFSGTVEQNRFDYEFKLLSREVAAAFKPLLEVATTIVNRARRFMEGLGAGGQDAVMAGGLALGAYGSYRMASAVGGLGMGLMGMRGLGGGMAAAPVTAGAAGAAAAGAGGGGAMTAAAGAGTAAAGTAAVGFRGRLASLAGRAGGGLGMLSAIPVAASSLYDAAGATSRLLNAKDDDSKNRAAAGFLRGVEDGTFDPLGIGRLATTFGGRNPALVDLEKKGFGAPAKPNDRRSVTPADFGFAEIGSSYGRVLESSLSSTAMAEEEKAAAAAAKGGGSGTLTEIRDTLQGIFDWATGDLFSALKPKPPVS